MFLFCVSVQRKKNASQKRHTLPERIAAKKARKSQNEESERKQEQGSQDDQSGTALGPNPSQKKLLRFLMAAYLSSIQRLSD
jgi:hypothetical protein